jgi:hypothetical protein
VDTSAGRSSAGPSWTGGDYVSGERVFAPPTGTLDVDWVTPALVEAVAREHGRAVDRDQARAWVVTAWAGVRETAAESGVRPGDVEPSAVLTRMAPTEPDTAALAVRVVLDAVRAFGVT